jgi:hypothetical protein
MNVMRNRQKNVSISGIKFKIKNHLIQF